MILSLLLYVSENRFGTDPVGSQVDFDAEVVSSLIGLGYLSIYIG